MRLLRKGSGIGGFERRFRRYQAVLSVAFLAIAVFIIGLAAGWSFSGLPLRSRAWRDT